MILHSVHICTTALGIMPDVECYLQSSVSYPVPPQCEASINHLMLYRLSRLAQSPSSRGVGAHSCQHHSEHEGHPIAILEHSSGVRMLIQAYAGSVSR